jgi:hypothetical protein
MSHDGTAGAISMHLPVGPPLCCAIVCSQAEAELKLSQLEAEIAAANAVTPADGG